MHTPATLPSLRGAQLPGGFVYRVQHDPTACSSSSNKAPEVRIQELAGSSPANPITASRGHREVVRRSGPARGRPVTHKGQDEDQAGPLPDGQGDQEGRRHSETEQVHRPAPTARERLATVPRSRCRRERPAPRLVRRHRGGSETAPKSVLVEVWSNFGQVAGANERRTDATPCVGILPGARKVTNERKRSLTAARKSHPGGRRFEPG